MKHKAKNTIDHRLRKNARAAEMWAERKRAHNKLLREERVRVSELLHD